MQEYLIHHRDKWWHFFIKPFYGLCYRKKEGERFLHFEVLLPDICEDFCAISSDGLIYLVCQNKSGSILYLIYDGENWRKSVLLESKTANPYPKHFTLIPMSGHINLFYVIVYKEKHMLIHQLLDRTEKPPAVVDHIMPTTPPFIVFPCIGTEITLLYENESCISGFRTYRWSQKAFSRFVPVHPALGCRVRAMYAETDERTLYAGLLLVDSVVNLVCFEKNAAGDFGEPVTVYLDCPLDAAPIFCKNEDKLFLVWREKGGIMSSFSLDEGKKWSKPIRYMKGASLEPVLFAIWEADALRYAYGHQANHEVVLYASPDLHESKDSRRTFRSEGYEAEVFAQKLGGLPAEDTPSPDSLLEHFRQELSALKEDLFSLRCELQQLKECMDAIKAKE